MPFKAYLAELQRNLKSGQATEPSYYPALKALVESLDPSVIAVSNPKKTPHGSPDLSIKRKKNVLEFPVGWIEAKELGEGLDKWEKHDQLKRYRHLGNLILTDFLEFRWYANDQPKARLTALLGTLDGRKVKVDSAGVAAVRELLLGFLSHKISATRDSRELARRMAQLAHFIRDAILVAYEREPAAGTLHKQLEAFRETLIPDLKEDQFADMYAQTIAYGMFAAACQPRPATEPFTREKAGYLIPKTNPFLRKLFSEIAGPDLPQQIQPFVDDLVALLRESDLRSVLEDLRAARKDPVIHLYEGFLHEYDPKEKKIRGVYYTPEPVVSYIVRSIDYLLKTRFGKQMGLADKDVLVLDPACGTGTFLYFVIRQIHETLCQWGQKGQWNSYVAENLLKRIFGFELLMAPYAVAHLKLGLLLKELGYQFDTDERLGIYLTNTLEEAIQKSEIIFAQWIADEANAASEIKRDKPIMVVLGNPPYSGISANRGRWITKLIEDYRKVDGKPLGEKKVWLKNDYIKFVRFAQWRIERTGYGILGFITDHSYLDSPTFRGMRQNLLKTFGETHVLNLHGNAKRREKTPAGGEDHNVFDITQGVAIALLTKPASKASNRISYADLWGQRQAKYDGLVNTSISSTIWKEIKPQPPFHLFVPLKGSAEAGYLAGWSVKDIFPTGSNGIQTSRDALVVGFDGDSLVKLIESFIDHEKTTSEIRREFFGEKRVGNYPPGDTREWKLREGRSALQRDRLWRKAVCAYLYRPCDERQLLYLDLMVDWPRAEVMRHLKKPNYALCVGRAGLVTAGAWDLVFSTKLMCDHNLFYRGSSLNFPLYLYGDGKLPRDLFKGSAGRTANLNPAFVRALCSKLGLAEPDWISEGVGQTGMSAPPQEETAGPAQTRMSAPPQQEIAIPGQTRMSAPPQQEVSRLPQEEEGKRVISVGQTFLSARPRPELQKTRRRLPHWTLEGSTYFITFRLAARQLNSEEIVLVREHILSGDPEFYRLLAVVVMPDHVHLVLLPQPGVALSRVMKGIKGATARQLNQRRATQGTVWQDESFDRIVRDQAELNEKLQYMLNNPVKAGLTDDPWGYPGWYLKGQTGMSAPPQKEMSGLHQEGEEKRVLPEGQTGMSAPPLGAQEGLSPEDVFHYIYAVFHSPTYRRRYAEFLKIDFPRVPLTSDKKLFAALVEKGAELVSLHLMESPKVAQFITKYEQPGDHVVEKVRWLDLPEKQIPLPPGRDRDDKARVSRAPCGPTGRVYINKTQYFEGVPKDVWEFHIGGYQVCEKWLKDRQKAGRKLSTDDIDHYQKIVVALNETIRLMGEIDEVISGWPLP